MSLKTSPVHRNLDVKIKIGGLEALDLLFVLIFASVMNLIFGQTSLKTILVFILPIIMLIILFFAKRNKPDKYLIHLFRFYYFSGLYPAGSKIKNKENLQKRIIIE